MVTDVTEEPDLFIEGKQVLDDDVVHHLIFYRLENTLDTVLQLLT